MFKHSNQGSEQSSSMPNTREKICDKNSQDQEDNPDIELVQKCLPDQGTFQT